MAPQHDGMDRLLALGRRLRALRERAGLTGGQLAAALDWKQPRVSRLELARQNVSPADVDAWCAATGATEADRAELLGMLDQAREDQHAWRDRFRHGQAAVQAGYNTLYSRARHVRVFSTALIPSQLQTPAYARAVLTTAALQAGKALGDIDAAVEARMARKDYLHDKRCQFDLLISEAALRSGVAAPGVMTDQCERIAAVDLSNVSVGVLPLAAPARVLLMNGFTMIDGLVLVETISRELRHVGPEAETYRRVWGELWRCAVVGDDARRFLADAAADLA